MYCYMIIRTSYSPNVQGFSNCFSCTITLHFFRKCDIIQDLWHNTTDFITDKHLSAWSDTDEIISHHLAWSLLTWAQQYYSQGQLQCFHLDAPIFAVLLGCSPTLFILRLPYLVQTESMQIDPICQHCPQTMSSKYP